VLLHRGRLVERFREGSWAFFRLRERGSAADIARAMPVLEQLCRRIEPIGALGSGATMKLGVNLPLLVYWQALGEALAAGVLSSAVPLLCDMLALRRVPAQFFGVFMSVNPVFAALAGLVVLDQHLVLTGWLAIAVIVAVNTVAVTAPRRRPDPRQPGHHQGQRAP